MRQSTGRPCVCIIEIEHTSTCCTWQGFECCGVCRPGTLCILPSVQPHVGTHLACHLANGLTGSPLARREALDGEKGQELAFAAQCGCSCCHALHRFGCTRVPFGCGWQPCPMLAGSRFTEHKVVLCCSTATAQETHLLLLLLSPGNAAVVSGAEQYYW